VALMTNAPRTHGTVARRLERMGLPRDAWDVIVASGDATQEAMLMGAAGRKLWHVGPGATRISSTTSPRRWPISRRSSLRAMRKAEGIICTGPFDDSISTPRTYRGRFLSAKTRGLKMLSANPDSWSITAKRRIHCAGALAQLYEEMGGEVLSFGKPHPPIYDLARRGWARRA
jgi:ribonucleotide monophosphatase NagD (HAD superfamily)